MSNRVKQGRNFHCSEKCVVLESFSSSLFQVKCFQPSATSIWPPSQMSSYTWSSSPRPTSGNILPPNQDWIAILPACELKLLLLLKLGGGVNSFTCRHIRFCKKVTKFCKKPFGRLSSLASRYQPSFHGVDLSALRGAAVDEYFRQPIVVCSVYSFAHKSCRLVYR